MSDLFQGGTPVVIGPAAPAGAPGGVQMVMMRLKRTVKIGGASHGPNTILSVPAAQAGIWRGDGTAEDYTPSETDPEKPARRSRRRAAGK